MPTTPGLRNPRVMQFSGPASVSLFPSPASPPIPPLAERYGKALVMREASLIMNSRPLHAGAALRLSGTTLYITA